MPMRQVPFVVGHRANCRRREWDEQLRRIDELRYCSGRDARRTVRSDCATDADIARIGSTGTVAPALLPVLRISRKTRLGDGNEPAQSRVSVLRNAESALAEFLGVGDEFGIGARAEFEEIDALALAFGGHAKLAENVEGRIQAVGKRQDKAQ